MPVVAQFALGALALLGTYFVLAPLIFPRMRAAGVGDALEMEDILSRRAEVYGSIKDLEFERARGRLGDQEFEELRDDYIQEASRLLSKEDAFRSEKVQKQIEAEVAKRRENGRPKGASAAKVGGTSKCGSCGATVLDRFRFCPECGEKMESV